MRPQPGDDPFGRGMVDGDVTGFVDPPHLLPKLGFVMQTVLFVTIQEQVNVYHLVEDGVH